MKLVFKGWIGKSWELHEIMAWQQSMSREYVLDMVKPPYKHKGPRDSWSTDAWPLKRVKITLEVEE